MGEDVSPEEVDELFKQMDVDGSGVIELDEFAAMVKAMNPEDSEDINIEGPSTEFLVPQFNFGAQESADKLENKCDCGTVLAAAFQYCPHCGSKVKADQDGIKRVTKHGVPANLDHLDTHIDIVFRFFDVGLSGKITSKEALMKTASSLCKRLQLPSPADTFRRLVMRESDTHFEDRLLGEGGANLESFTSWFKDNFIYDNGAMCVQTEDTRKRRQGVPSSSQVSTAVLDDQINLAFDNCDIEQSGYIISNYQLFKTVALIRGKLQLPWTAKEIEDQVACACMLNQDPWSMELWSADRFWNVDQFKEWFKDRFILSLQNRMAHAIGNSWRQQRMKGFTFCKIVL